MNKVERLLAYIYIFLLPVTLIQISKAYLFSMGTSASFYVNILCIVLLLLSIAKNKRMKSSNEIGANRKALIAFIIIITILNLITLIMAFILHEKLGTVIRRDTYIAALPYVVYNIQIIFIVIYNIYLFRNINQKQIIKIIYYSIAAVIAVGYLEIIISVTKNMNIAKLFYFTDILGQFSTNYTLSCGRVNLLSSEASTAGVFITIFVIPFIAIVFSYKLLSRKKLIILLMTIIPIAVFARSSTMLIGVVCDIVVINLWLISKYKSKLFPIAFIETMVIIISGFILRDSLNDIRYLIFYKAADVNNLSTVHRISSVYTNAVAFINYPILGVGNGIQGFFYIKYLPDWAFKSSESSAIYYYGSIWPGGGGFIPSYIAGYGILGVLLFIILIRILLNNLKKLKNTEYEYIYSWCIICFIIFLIQAIVSISIYGEYYIIFILSLAFITVNKKPLSSIVQEG